MTEKVSQLLEEMAKRPLSVKEKREQVRKGDPFGVRYKRAKNSMPLDATSPTLADGSTPKGKISL